MSQRVDIGVSAYIVLIYMYLLCLHVLCRRVFADDTLSVTQRLKALAHIERDTERILMGGSEVATREMIRRCLSGVLKWCCSGVAVVLQWCCSGVVVCGRMLQDVAGCYGVLQCGCMFATREMIHCCLLGVLQCCYRVL